ncbi:MAG: PA14 domain-containing protein [Verrucomicrobiota bacterium]
MGIFLTFAFEAQAATPDWADNPDVSIRIQALPGQMKYDLTSIDVEPGDRVRINFSNPDDLEHNLILLDEDPEDPDAGKFIEACIMLAGEGPAKGWVIDSPRVLASSGMLKPDESTDLFFEAPPKEGSYRFICTYPGHGLLMRGKLNVKAKPSPFQSLSYRVYQGDFYEVPDFEKLTPIEEGVADFVDVGLIAGRDNHAILWEGVFETASSGKWTFSVGSDDGAALAIDGEFVTGRDGIHYFRATRDNVELEAGIHQFRLGYFDASGVEELSVIGQKGDETLFFSKDTSATTRRNPDAYSPIPLPIPDPDRAVVHRTFLEGEEPRSIAVALPGGLNYSWNADTCNLTTLWRGDFIDVGNHWNGRQSRSRIAGSPVLQLNNARSLSSLPSPDAPWIDHSKERLIYEKDTPLDEMKKEIVIGVPDDEFRFLGYQLDETGVPTFRYRFQGLGVSDRLAPDSTQSGSLVRQLSFRGSVPEQLHLMLATGSGFQPLTEDEFKLNGQLAIEAAGADLHIRKTLSSRLYESDEREAKARDELLLPISEEGDITIHYRWLTSAP